MTDLYCRLCWFPSSCHEEHPDDEECDGCRTPMLADLHDECIQAHHDFYEIPHAAW